MLRKNKLASTDQVDVFYLLGSMAQRNIRAAISARESMD
jgi:hypothetical protein